MRKYYVVVSQHICFPKPSSEKKKTVMEEFEKGERKYPCSAATLGYSTNMPVAHIFRYDQEK